MHHLIHMIVALTLASTCSIAAAQFSFQIPGLDKLGGKSPLNLDSLVGNLQKSTTETSEADEIVIGKEFAATLLGAKPLVADARLQRYVNVLGRWLALHTERPSLPWTFGVLDDPGFNAFATPGGYVFVTRGLVERMQNEAELAGVLAHEMAHVLRRHHLSAVQRSAGMQLIGDFVGGLRRGGNQELKSATMNVTRNLYSKGLDKDDEFEADRLGVVIAARAGYDAYGLPSVLKVLQSHSSQEADFSLLFKTHPAPGLRVALLEQLMRNRFDGIQGSVGRSLNERLTEFER